MVTLNVVSYIIYRYLPSCVRVVEKENKTLQSGSSGTGKWHNGISSYTRSFSCGDNIFFGGMWNHWNVPVCGYDSTGEYDNVIDFVLNCGSDREIEEIAFLLSGQLGE